MKKESKEKKLKTLKRKFYVRGSVAILLYMSWLFTANLLTVILNMLYVHSQQFVTLLTLGSAIIIMVGLKGTIDEMVKETAEEEKRILGEKR